MAAIGLKILIIFALTVISGLFAMSEIAVVSARKSRLQQRAQQGQAGARVALELAGSPNRFLSTIQIGISLIAILSGSYGEATLTEELHARLSQISSLAPYSQAISFFVVVLGITYLSVVVGELVPKQLALNNPEKIAARIAIPMSRLSSISAPVVRLLTRSADLIMRLLRIRPSSEPPITEDEIEIMIEQGTQAGVFEAAEQDMVKGVFRFGERRIGVMMTHRSEIEWLDRDAAPEEIAGLIAASHYSRFPVASGSLDHAVGVLRARDVLAGCLAGRPPDLDTVMEPALFVPETMPALEALELFKRSGASMALVIDEYGGVQGLVTLADIGEAILGDVSSADTVDKPRIVMREDGSWLLDGLLPVDELRDLLDLGLLPGEDKGHYQTLGGFIMTYLGHIPAVADTFEYGGLRFEVVDMDGRRVDKVLVSRLAGTPVAETSGAASKEPAGQA